ncbi:MAG: hypothetical protein CO113_01370 [Elusimicrobia bacterium CG_4_9_14_3_um_filter_62_55]|nr:MAG: hypothetical protein COR54_07605 [Elusimicrobia bacterium CG22_combo_CG10-13_8_21_14_all_63_91]PJA14603.1 MAG: hypothetical protein COX66_12245 [Elusimicrobia bacterium CG_4_10_14_0_2_um_filter_63_34]PJB26814.1 MAG: hypothetical protein CO113_01370 [Elusimicrobia bacterium CG_4_9_14_3_um_filter_62_55]
MDELLKQISVQSTESLASFTYAEFALSITMAVGMACGVRLYGQAVLFTGLASVILMILEKTQFGTSRADERLLRFSLAEGEGPASRVDAAVSELSKGAVLLSSETLAGKRVLTYSVELPQEKASAGLLEELSKKLDGADVKMLTGFEKFSI